MNTLINDYGERKIAVGAPGSPERLWCQYPYLISRIAFLIHTLSGAELENAIDEYEWPGGLTKREKDTIGELAVTLLLAGKKIGLVGDSNE